MSKGTIALYILCLAVVLFSFLSIAHFVMFLSTYSFLKHVSSSSQLSISSYNKDTVVISVIKNMSLLLIFMLQHSLQASMSVKIFFQHHGLAHVHRLFYILGTSTTLEILMFYWTPIPYCLWSISTKNPVVWWCFTIIHTICWTAMYGSWLILDVPEFFGVKQVYYYVIEYPPPAFFKSESLNRFYSHIRHVNFIPLLIVLFIHPVMQLDRFLLAYSFLSYMALRFNVDEVDYRYQTRMFKKKVRVIYAELGETPPHWSLS